MRVVELGNLASAPELRYTPNGKAVLTVSLADNRMYKGLDAEAPYWIRLEAWEELAEELNLADFQKGDFCKVAGFFNIETWESEESGYGQTPKITLTAMRLWDAEIDGKEGGNGNKTVTKPKRPSSANTGEARPSSRRREAPVRSRASGRVPGQRQQPGEGSESARPEVAANDEELPF